MQSGYPYFAAFQKWVIIVIFFDNSQASRDPEGLCVVSHFGLGLTTLNQTSLLKIIDVQIYIKKDAVSHIVT